MAFDFDGANSEYIDILDSGVYPTVPCAFSAWFYSTSDSAGQVIFGAQDKDETSDRIGLTVQGNVDGDPIRCFRDTSDRATTSTGYSINTWHQGVAIYADVDDLRVLLDNGGKDVNTETFTFPAIDSCLLYTSPSPRD